MLSKYPSILILFLLPILASGQQDSTTDAPGVLEEVVVSGYRLTSPIELDSSLTLFNAETIDRASVQHFEELVQMVPNMNFSGEGSRARYFLLRGLGEREQYEGAPNPSVGFFIDDVDLSGIGGVGGLFDIDQVEVLRGPQSARYGSSALAGVVYMRSAAPTTDPSMHGELTAGGDGLYSAGIAASGPLGEQINGRIALQHFQQDGFRDNVYLGDDDTNGRDELTARAKLDWNFAAGWNALLTGLWLDFDNGYDAFSVDNGDTVQSDKPGQDSQQTHAASLRITGPLGGGMEFVSITSYTNSDIYFSFDGDWGNDAFWRRYGKYAYDYVYQNPRTRNTQGQELRLVSTPTSRLFGGTTDWVVGISANRLDEDNAINSIGIYDDSAEENFCAPCRTDRQIESQYRADTLALFGSLDQQLNERWSLSAGLRLEHWEAEYQDRWQDINYPGVPPEGDSCTQFDCQPGDDLWGGHLSISYEWRQTLRGYARVARGFKSGGFNPSLAALQTVSQLGPEFIAYEPEHLWNYEAGLKGVWLNGRLSGNLSAFIMDRKNAQLSQSSQQVPFDPNSFVFVTYNGDAKVRGLEADWSWQWTETLELHGTLGLLDSKIRNTPKTAVISPNAINRELAYAPSWTLNLGASWNGANGWFGRVDFSASDGYYFDISHNQASDSYALVKLRIGKNWGRWTLSAWGRNIFDEKYATRGFYFGNEPPLFENTLYTKFGDPANFGGTLEYHY